MSVTIKKIVDGLIDKTFKLVHKDDQYFNTVSNALATPFLDGILDTPVDPIVGYKHIVHQDVDRVVNSPVLASYYVDGVNFSNSYNLIRSVDATGQRIFINSSGNAVRIMDANLSIINEVIFPHVARAVDISYEHDIIVAGDSKDLSICKISDGSLVKSYKMTGNTNEFDFYNLKSAHIVDANTVLLTSHYGAVLLPDGTRTPYYNGKVMSLKLDTDTFKPLLFKTDNSFSYPDLDIYRPTYSVLDGSRFFVTEGTKVAEYTYTKLTDSMVFVKLHTKPNNVDINPYIVGFAIDGDNLILPVYNDKKVIVMSLSSGAITYMFGEGTKAVNAVDIKALRHGQFDRLSYIALYDDDNYIVYDNSIRAFLKVSKVATEVVTYTLPAHTEIVFSTVPVAEDGTLTIPFGGDIPSIDMVYKL